MLTDLGGEDQAAAVSEAERERLQPRPEVGSDCPASKAAEGAFHASAEHPGNEVLLSFSRSGCILGALTPTLPRPRGEGN